MTEAQRGPRHPPEPPAMKRRFRLGLVQWIGLPIILAVPILALFGVFGETRDDVRVSGRALDVLVEYPARVRHGTTTSLEIRVRNMANQPLDTVTVSFDTAYVTRFTNPIYVPSSTKAHEVTLLNVLPAEIRLAMLELRAEKAGRHTGGVTAASGGDSAVVSFRTFVFP